MNLDRVADCHQSKAVAAAAWAVKGHHELTLCAHHVGTHRRRLEDEGWQIIAMTTTKAGHGVGTESTGVHFALES